MGTRKKTKPRQQISRKITPLQERFCHEYVKDFNATQAAKRAGYSAKTCFVQGPRLLDVVSVHSLIEKLRAEQVARLKMSADEVLQEVAKLARSNIKRVFAPATPNQENPGAMGRGIIMSPDEMDDDVAATVESFEARLEFAADGAPPEEIRKVKMHSKLGALKLLMQHHKLIGPEVEVNLGVALAERLAAARKRTRKEGS